MTVVVDDLINLSDKMGFLETVKSKLVRQPDPALRYLAAAVTEIRKIYAALDEELSTLTALTLEQEELPEERATLLNLESAKLFIRMNEARGHCHKINNIYKRYLNPWLRRIIPGEDEQMRQLFDDMSNSDLVMYRVINNLGNWLGPKAIEIRSLVDAGDLVTARQRLHQAIGEVETDRQALNSAMQKLFELSADFTKASGAI